MKVIKVLVEISWDKKVNGKMVLIMMVMIVKVYRVWFGCWCLFN